MTRIFGIGDIHGCLHTFRSLLSRLDLQDSDLVCCVGDYIDRGPDSRGVIDHILDLRERGYNIRTLRGNHEQLMLDSADDPKAFRLWVSNGGDQTLKSFGVASYQQIEQHYRDFFETTEHFLLHDDFIFVHAGLNFEDEDPLQDLEAMMWVRNFTPDLQWLAGRKLVHGHTPLPATAIIQQSRSQVINIDGGCVYPMRSGMGHLFALAAHSMEFVSVRNIDF